jgi:toxin ParE1/3/4
MARELTWSPEALEDVESIASYIERDSPWYAKIVATQIVDVAESIPDNLYLGRIVPELADRNIRERFVYSYRIVYRIDDQQILIVAVIHGSRLLSRTNIHITDESE